MAPLSNLLAYTLGLVIVLQIKSLVFENKTAFVKSLHLFFNFY